MPDRLKIAIAGVGWAGSRHIEAIRELGDVYEIAGLIDNDSDHLSETADSFGISNQFASIKQAVESTDIDVIDIATPHTLHESMAVEAAGFGKHVVVEKPMAMTVDEATNMIDAADQNNVRIFVAENHSYEPYISFLRDHVQSGKFLGEVTTASVAAGFRPRGEYSYPGRRAWLALPDQGGTGTWMLHGIHTMAGVRRVFGEVESIYMQENKTKSFERDDVEGTLSALLTTENGTSIHLTQSPETRFRGNTGGYLIHGENGSIRATAYSYELFSDEFAGEVTSYPASSLSSYALEFQSFSDAIRNGTSSPTDGVSERRTLAIIQAGFESLESGVPVKIRDRFGEL